MKKSELKKELEIAKATLELAMVALRVAAEKNNKLNSKETQSSDKITEPNNSDWFIKNDDGTYTIKLNPSIDISNWLKKEGDSSVTGFSESEPKKETPLTDLAREVDFEKQANEAIDKFMPLVTGWRANDPCGLRDAEVKKVVWSLSDYNHKKAAIKVAIAHFELIQKQGGWLAHIDTVQIINELKKMLSE